MSSVISYGCATVAGDSVEALWGALQSNRDLSVKNNFLFHNRGTGTDLDLLTGKLTTSFRNMLRDAPPGASERLMHGNYGVILASTKGRTNDFIWNASAEQLKEDPLTPLLTSVLNSLELRPFRSVVVSNACSSGLAAARLAQLWLKQGMGDVIILAADAVSDFVVKGFTSLKVISDQRPRPFAQERNGFLLGEAAACLWLSQTSHEGSFKLHPIGLDSEGSAVTRPTLSGESLVRAALRIPGLLANPPEILIAHGTGTPINDQTEDLAFNELFKNTKRPMATGSKWAIGHTLAASGAIDMILACEILRLRNTFSLRTTSTVDPAFSGRYLISGSSCPVGSRVMVSSLGFGGMHAAALLEAAV